MQNFSNPSNVRHASSTGAKAVNPTSTTQKLLNILKGYPDGITTLALTETIYGSVTFSSNPQLLRDARRVAIRKQIQRAREFLRMVSPDSKINYCNQNKTWTFSFKCQNAGNFL